MGLTEEQFWKTTPAEYNSFVGEHLKAEKSKVELARATAYWTAVLGRVKDMPSFDRWMSPPKPAKALVGDEAEEKRRDFEEIVALHDRMRRAKEEEADGS